jgi:hypothetical protein
MSFARPTVLFRLSALSLLLVNPARASSDSAGIEFFEQKIRPVLADNCYKCHSSEAEKIRGGLRLDTRDGVLKGGDNGPAIVPGEPEKSLLIKAVRYADAELQMPPKDKKLAPEQIAALEAWVKMGAPDPRTNNAAGSATAETIAEKARQHWAFQPVHQSPLPVVKNMRWVRAPADAFILAKLESNGLAPSPQADRRVLIRRATFDLIGLPPTPEEVAAFAADKSPDAFEKIIDRLLASPRYGERWGRHWLDVARYADTKGYVFEEERRYPYSYTYRDWVIRAFNEDLPYDQFIVQQIAADLLPLGEDKRPLAALGFLTVGRRFLNNIHDIIDDRIDVVCRGTMGLTVACARCHDHKYDPIPTKDYYSLYGIFDSSREPEEKPLLGTISETKAHQEYLAEHEKRVKERADFKAKKEIEMAAKLRNQVGDYLLAVAEVQRAGDKADNDRIARGKKLDPGVLRRWADALPKWKDGPIFSPWAAFAALPENEFTNKTAEVLSRFVSSDSLNPIVAKAFATNAPASLKDVAERYGNLFSAVEKQWQEFVKEEKKGDENAGDARREPALPDAAEEALRQVLYASDAPPNVPRHELERMFDVPASQKVRQLQRKIEELDATHPGAPARAMAMVDKSNPHNAKVLLRGNPGTPGPEVPRQFLEVIAGPQRQPFTNGSGRLELARAIVSPANPLTARVLVNRVWAQHFGAPLVRTPSDFGLRSEPPTHPELLDYLADWFVENGWSMKKLHRLLMLSSAYQQTSDNDARNTRVDPDNRLLWRMNRQRLDFEAMRDTVLAVAGKLDLTAGGHPVDITTEPFATRRTVYAYIERQNLPNLFRAFDFASPDATSPQRFFTTVPQQALFLMNSPFVVQQAKSLVTCSEFANATTRDERTRALYLRAFQREPTREEFNLAAEFFRTKTGLESRTPPSWQYGWGEFDESSKRVKHFELLPHFTGSAFQGGESLPDGTLGWILLNDIGGHAGNDTRHAAIRRWTAPRDGVVSVKGTLNHSSDQGDGVRGRLVSSSEGELGQWRAHNGKAETNLDRVTVRRGDNLDFVTDCFDTVSYDSFEWPAAIEFANGKDAAEVTKWDTKKDFVTSARAQHKPLTDWEKYAQVLLLANELVFVD